MAKYIVSYNVTVDVVVNLDDDAIEKVVINDDCMGDPYGYFVAEDNLDNWHEIVGVDGEALTNRLYAITEGGTEPQQEWPSWDHGW